MKYLTYKNILTVVGILTLWAILFMINNAITVNANNDRYKIIKCDTDLIFLLDKKTGLVWRNVYDNKEKIPNSWQFMSYIGSVVPEGEQNARDIRAKNILKEHNIK